MSKNFDICPPDPSAHFQAARAYGYSLERAVADIIDNSITANAKNIHIVHHFDNENSKIAIIDDGDGMTEEELIDGMRLNSKNPLDERNENDLGRFGLGLKTASLSQCETLTVRSKKNGNDNTRCWDLEFISEQNEYALLKKAPTKDGDFLLNLLDRNKQGTIVLWENLNFDFKSDEEVSNKESFQRFIDLIIQYNQVIFHRFLGIESDVKICISNYDNYDSPIFLKGWDPFLSNNKMTKKLPLEPIDGSKIKIVPYILPHFSHLKEEDHSKLSGIYGFTEHQGFYVYRNKRLIVPGSWLNLGLKKDTHFNLARIKLDMPNDRDFEWKLDVTKSEVIPPENVRKKLSKIATLTRSEASNVFGFRGKRAARSSKKVNSLFWNSKITRGKNQYFINREHPLILNILSLVNEKKLAKKIETLLKFIEEYIPVDSIFSEYNSDPKSFEKNIIDIEKNNFGLDLVEEFTRLFEEKRKTGLSEHDAFSQTIGTEPFTTFSAEFESLKQRWLSE